MTNNEVKKEVKNCFSCRGLCPHDRVYYCNIKDNKPVNNYKKLELWFENNKIDNLDLPCKFHRPKPQSQSTDDSYLYDEDSPYFAY